MYNLTSKFVKILIAAGTITSATFIMLVQLRTVHKPKIVIFTSRGGGGQTSATAAIAESLQPEYQVEINDIFSELLLSLDFTPRLTRGRMTGVDLYDYLMKKKYNWSMNNIMYPLGKWRYGKRSKATASLVHQYIQKEQPDAVISVIPISNNAIMKACVAENIPFILFSVDLDPEMFISNIVHPEYTQFKLALPFIDEEIRNTTVKSGIPESNIAVTGYPIRSSFRAPKNHTAIKKEWHIPDNKPIILVMLGSLGSTTLMRVAHQLKKIKISAHILFCVGKSDNQIAQLAALEFPLHLSFTTIGFTNKIADLMAIADIFITKSGSGSFAEAIYMQLPMLLDGTSTVLLWEQGNHRFLKEHNLGDIITSYKQIPDMVTHYLENQQLRTSIKERMAAMSTKNGAAEIKKLIKELLEQN